MVDQLSVFFAKKVILITGGAGFIGSNLAEKLLNIGAKRVKILDDLSTGSKENIQEFLNSEAFEFINGSITDYDICQSALKDVDIVFHMAALGSVPRSIDNPIATNASNVTGFLNVLEAARRNEVSSVIYSSSSSVYGDDKNLPKQEEKIGKPLSPYAVSKRTNELYAQVFADLYDLSVIGLRYFNVFGPKQNIKGPYAAVIPIFIENLLNKKKCFINGDGSISRDFTFVENVVHANLLAALESDKVKTGIYNVAMGNQISLKDLYDNIENELKSGLMPNYREERVGDIASSMANIDQIKGLFGYEPVVSFEEGLRKTIDWYRKSLSK